MLSKKVFALLIPAVFAGSVLADVGTADKATASGQITFTGEVTAVACTLHIPTAVTLFNVGQAQATGANNADYVGEASNFVVALQNCTFQTAGTVLGRVRLKDAAENFGTEDHAETLMNNVKLGKEPAQGVGVQVRYLGKKNDASQAKVLKFVQGNYATVDGRDLTEGFIEETFSSTDGDYAFHFDAAIRRMGSAQVFAGAVEAQMDVEVAYK